MSKADMKARHELSLSAALLLVGGAIYVLFRPLTLLMFRVADHLGLTPAIEAARQLTDGCHLPHFVTDSLPAGLWAAAYVLLIDSLLKRQPTKQKIGAASIIPLTGAVSEVLQSASLLPGTFDWADLLCYLLPLGAYIYIESRKQKNDRKQQSL